MHLKCLKNIFKIFSLCRFNFRFSSPGWGIRGFIIDRSIYRSNGHTPRTRNSRRCTAGRKLWEIKKCFIYE